MSTRARTISADDLRRPSFYTAPHEAKVTAVGLWLHCDVEGRRELLPTLIAGDLYPGEDAAHVIEEHIELLEDCGFLQTYRVDGREWLALSEPLRVDARNARSECPPPPLTGSTRHVVAVERKSERAGERSLTSNSLPAQSGRDGLEQQRPTRPLLLDAPSYGCPSHPDGSLHDCGPCGTARHQHDLWLTRRRYEIQLRNTSADTATSDI